MRRHLSFLIMLILAILTGAVSAAEENITSWQQMDGKVIGTLTGSTGGPALEKNLPEAKIAYYDSVTDIILALDSHKIDGACIDKSFARYLSSEKDNLRILDGSMGKFDNAPVFPKNQKGQDLEKQYSEFVKKLWEDGSIDEIDAKWFSADQSKWDVPDYENLPDTNGTLHMAADPIIPPFVMMVNNRIAGYDVDIAARFCEAYGYRLEIEPMSFAAVIPAVISGKCDFASSGITITEERAENVLFSEPIYHDERGIIVLKTETGNKAGPQKSIPEYTEFSDLSGKTVSMLTGAPFEELVRSKVPDVGGFSYYNNMADIILALKSGKTDACLNNNAIAQLAVNRDPDIALFPQSLKDGVFGFAFAKGSPDRELWQAAFDKIDQDTIQALWEKWSGADESKKVIPEQDWPGLNGTVKAAVCDTLEPMSYVGANGQLMGFDIEMILLTAKELDVHVDFIGMEFSAILASVQSGKALLGAGSIIVTDERKEAVDFVEYFPAAFVLVVRSVQNPGDDTDLAAGWPGISLDELNGKRIGVQAGTNYDEMVQKRLPDAKILYFNNKADLNNALMTDKIDGYAIDLPVIILEMSDNDALTFIPEYLDTCDFAYILPKNKSGEILREKINEFLEKITSDGTFFQIQKKWLTGDRSLWTIDDYESFPTVNGTIRLATDPTYEPLGFVYNNKVMGYEIDLIAHFCRDYGYGLEIVNTNYDSILSSVQSNKADIGAGGIAATDERSESVLFSEPYYHGGTVMAVLKQEKPAESAPQNSVDTSSYPEGENTSLSEPAGKKIGVPASLWGSVCESFERTFIREDRYKLFGQGVLTTLLITVLSILFGTMLGFCIFMLCRNGNPFANRVTNVCLWIVQGMPGVVLLMILYYVIFGSVSISGIWVAVIGFTLTFGAAVFGLLKMGVGAVDEGQYDAAYALGYSNSRTFFRIILPQAIPHVVDAYKGEIVSLLKGTAIVGYIAVQDLTKMGDIVRSRTYEAFFPLIAVTIIYFLLEMLLGSFVKGIRIQIDPKRRSRKTILKGVNTNDQN